MEQESQSVDERAKGEDLLRVSVRELRLRLNLSQEAFAQLIGASPRTVARFEGEQAPSVKFLVQLAQLARARGVYDLARRFESAFVANTYRARRALYSGKADSTTTDDLGAPSDMEINAASGTGGPLDSPAEQREFRDSDSPKAVGIGLETLRGRIVPSLATSIHTIATAPGYEHFRSLFKELIIRSIDNSVESREQLFLQCAERIEGDPRLGHLRGLLHEIHTLVAGDVPADGPE